MAGGHGAGVATRVAGLDALRGVAIALVILRHAWPEGLGGAGIVGVTMFFALSGFLITGLLQSDITKRGRVDYARFYAHRAFRLLPALLAVLVAFVIVDGLIDLLGQRDRVPLTMAVALTYTADLPLGVSMAESMGHLWTLAIEEQFYLLWPLALVIALGAKKLGATIALGFAITTVALMTSIAIAAPEVERIYGLPSSWASAMLIGAGARIYRDRLDSERWTQRTRAIVLAVAIALLAAASFVPEAKSNPAMYIVGGPMIAVSAVILIFAAERRTTTPRWFTPLVLLGLISYAAYLWNYPLTIWLREVAPGHWRVLAPIATIGIATASWLAIERPARRLRNRVDARRARGTRPDR